jgi:hypothetical protein
LTLPVGSRYRGAVPRRPRFLDILALSITGLTRDARTGTILFLSSCDPLGANPFGAQFFTMRSDGSLSVEAPGPVSYSARIGG